MLCAITRKHGGKAQLGAPSRHTELRLRALAVIRGEIGTREQGENIIKHTKWWG
jgi:hypothetical protein